MSELIEYFKYLNEKNWGTGIYQWLYYIGIILVLILEKKKTARIIFGWLPLVFVFLVYNPLFNKLIRIVFVDPDPYYVRMFSFIPVTYGIGVGITEILTKTKRTLRAICLASIAITIALTCTDVYKALNMKPTANAEKVPAGLIEVIEAINKDPNRNKCVAVPYPLSTSIRQIDSRLITPYGRDDGLSDPLHRELSQAVPDVQFVMIEAGKRSTDYIVVQSNEECRKVFKESGYEPWGETENYIIYSVSNVPKVKKEYDEMHHVISVTNIDAAGNPIKTNQGYTTAAYEYDSWGYRTVERYLDEEGNPYVFNGGYYAVKYSYRYPSGLITSKIYFDKDDNPILLHGRYETRYIYNLKKQICWEGFFDADGNPMNLSSDCFSSVKKEYDDKGQIIQEKYYGIDGKETYNATGYFEIRKIYDNNGNVVEERTYDITGNLICRKDGYAIVHRSWNENNLLMREEYFDESGNPTTTSDGISVIERYYIDGVMIDEKEFDKEGNEI